jgi:hypothetical protein
MIKKDKVFELKIEEDDQVSGIDSISLVDEPAIEINWMYFSKEKEHGFNIPDGEDLKYSEMITQKGESEDDLLNDGWELHSMEHNGKEEFISSSPNSPSDEDTKEYLIRYKYILNPKAPGAPVKETTREFCKDLLSKNLVYRVEDLDNIVNDLGSSALVWRGSYNCRHLWSKLTYRRGPKPIENNGSVRTGRVDTGLELDILGYSQPDTRTSNPSFSKEKLIGEKVSMDYDDTLSTDRGVELAKRLLSEGKDLSIITRRQETDLGPVYKVAEGLGIPRNKVHGTNGKLKWETIKRLGIQTHYDNNPDEIKGIQDNLQGVRGIKFGYDNNLPSYVQELPKKKKKSFIDNFDYLISKEDMKKQVFQTDEEKRTIIGPCMVPNLRIPRKDSQGNTYEIFFSPETIKMIAEKYMRTKYLDNNDMMHDGKPINDVYVVESWIKEDMEDKSNKYGYQDTPIGTWFVAMKCAKTPEGDKVWNMVKSGELAGFSVSGWFEEVADFCREEMFLHQVVEILKKY